MINKKPFYFISIFLLTLLSISSFKSQTRESIEDELYNAVELSSQDVSKAIDMFTRILEESEKIKFDEGVLKCKGSLAILYFSSGEYEKAINISSDVETLARKLNDFSSLTGIYRTVSASYSILGLSDQAIQNLNKAENYAKYIKDIDIRHYRLALIYDSYSASIKDKNGNPDEIFSYIHRALNELNKISDEGQRSDILNAKYNVIGIQYIKLGNFYFENFNQNEKAESYYNKALLLYQNPKYRIEPGNQLILLSRLSMFYLEVENYNNSIKYGLEGLELTNEADYPQIRKDIYNALFKAYLQIDEKDKSKHYADLYTQLDDSLKKADRESINSSVNKIISNKEVITEKYMDSVLLIGGISVVLIAFIAYLLWRKKEKNLHKRYEILIDSLSSNKPIETQEIIPSEKIVVKEAQNKDTKEPSVNISTETVETLLAGLDKFEKANRFTKKEVNLGYLVNYLGTNTKYLHEILKSFKGKSFSQYINDLRIEYIIQLLYENPKYRSYKISTLADECGFSSREIFTIAFKKKTGISPSFFIKNISKNNSN